MINTLSINVLRFVLLLLIQVIVLNNINLFQLFNPYVYILFILLLPFNTPKWQIIISSFFLGILIDAFMNTPGINAAASVLLAYLRPFIIRFIAPSGGYEAEMKPTIESLGLQWFLSYTLLAAFLHHLLLFYIEVFRFSEFWDTLLRVIVNTIITSAIIIICQYLFYKKSKD